MELKRKRSEPGLNLLNSSFQLGSVSHPSTGMGMDTFAFGSNPVPSLLHLNRNPPFAHVPGRTMKRFRDNRPSESEVHQRTLNVLYEAQRQQTTATDHKIPIASPQRQNAPVAAQLGLPSSSQQTSLHSFWNLPSCPSASPADFMPPMTVETPTECEDCGQRLVGDNGDDDMMMDLDGLEGTSCHACGKHVCSHCSIGNLDEQRRCLSCAGTISTSTSAGNGAGRVSFARGMDNWLC